MASRWIQLRVPVGLTRRYNPWPSQYRPGVAVRTKAAERALSGWRPRGFGPARKCQKSDPSQASLEFSNTL